MSQPKSRKLLWAGIAAGVVFAMLLCAGGTVGVYFLMRPKTEPGVLRAPAEISSWRLSTEDHDLDWLEKQVRLSLDDIKSMVVAVYAVDQERMVVIAAEVAEVEDQELTLQALVNFSTNGEAPWENRTPFDPGSLGGIAKCGSIKWTNAEPSIVCGWASKTTVGLISWNGTSSTQARDEFLSVRDQILATRLPAA